MLKTIRTKQIIAKLNNKLAVSQACFQIHKSVKSLKVPGHFSVPVVMRSHKNDITNVYLNQVVFISDNRLWALKEPDNESENYDAILLGTFLSEIL